MIKIFHLKSLIPLMILIGAALISCLITISALAQEPTPGTKPLHYKSAQGLMPPAYVLDPNAPAAPHLSAAAISFLTPYTVRTVGSWPQVLAAADLTGDTLTDLAVASDVYFDPANDKSLHLLAQTGGNLSRTQILPAGKSPSAIVAADLTLDNRAEVVVALAGDNTLAVYSPTITSTPPLAGPKLLPLAGAPDALAVGDFSGDLRNDLAAIAPQTGKIHLWRGSSGGLVPLGSALPYPTGGFDALAVGDLDNDGDDDLAALRGSGYLSNSLVIYLQNSGTFPISHTLTPQTGGYLPHSVAVGDVNNDGLDDVVVTAGGNTPNAFVNVFPQISGTLTITPTVYNAYHLPSAVAVSDLNHDGREDVVALNDGWRSLSFYEQTGSGSLSPYLTTDLPYVSYHRPDALALADLNGDGGLDVGLVGYYHDLTLLFNAQPAPTTVISSPLEAAILPPGLTPVTGWASATTVAVEVRLKGFSNWQPATLTGQSWQATLTLPAEDRAFWLEARARDAAGRYQAPVSRRRIKVVAACYTVADNDGRPGSPDRLMLLDKTTAEVTLIGDTGTNNIEAIAFKPGSDVLYASNGGQLGRLNLTTGLFSRTSQPFGEGRGEVGLIKFSDVDGLSFDPASGIFYGTHRRTREGKKDVLFQIDPATGKRVPNAFGPGIDYRVISGTGLLDDIDDITIQPGAGQMYAASTENRGNSVLATLDKSSGVGSVLGSFGVKNVEGLAFLNDGLLYASTGILSPAATWNRLYTVNPATGAVTEIGPFSRQRDYEGLACPASPISPGPIQATPHVDDFAINEGLVSSAEAGVWLTISASTLPAQPDIRHILVREYEYYPETGQWTLAVQSDWLEYTATPSDYSWQVQPTAGVKYLQVWAADSAGEVSRVPYQAPLNFVPSSGELAQNEVHFYRYPLNPGDQLTARLEASSGDPDLAIWPVDYLNGWPAWVSNQTGGVDEISFVAPEEGLYQIEVHGYTAASYQLVVELTPADEVQISQEVQSLNSSKPQLGQPFVALDDEPTPQDSPPAPPSASAVEHYYLPVILRQ